MADPAELNRQDSENWVNDLPYSQDLTKILMTVKGELSAVMTHCKMLTLFLVGASALATYTYLEDKQTDTERYIEMSQSTSRIETRLSNFCDSVNADMLGSNEDPIC